MLDAAVKFRQRPAGRPLPPRKALLNATYRQMFSSELDSYLVLQHNNLTVAELVGIRQTLAASGYSLTVIRSGILARITKNTRHAAIRNLLCGPTCIIHHKDNKLEPELLKKALDAVTKHKKLLIFGGMFEGQFYTDVKGLAAMPGLEVQRAHIIGAIENSAQTLVRTLGANQSLLVRILEAKE